MKKFIGLLKKNKWFKVPLTILVCLNFLLIHSCKKDELSIDPSPSISSSLSSKKIKPEGRVRDIEGTWYKTVKIGDQWWMAENLKTSKLNDGTPIPIVVDNIQWTGFTSAAYCWYNNDEMPNKRVYGALYNWFAVNTGKICPITWHVPSDDEWKILEIYMAMTQEEAEKAGAWRGTDQGIQIKSEKGWSGPYPLGTNTVGFAALPAGIRGYTTGVFSNIGIETTFWTSSFDESTDYAWFRNIISEVEWANSRIYRNTTVKTHGFSIRCIKDN